MPHGSDFHVTVDKNLVLKKRGKKKLPSAQFVYVIFFQATRKLTQDSFPVNRTRIAYAVCTFCRFFFSERVGYARPLSPLIPSKLWEQF